jgi:hypothetical protein
MFFIQKAFSEASNYVNFDPYTHYAWEFDKPSKAVKANAFLAATTAAPASTTPTTNAPATSKAKDNEMKQKQDIYRVDRIIHSLVNQVGLSAQL